MFSCKKLVKNLFFACLSIFFICKPVLAADNNYWSSFLEGLSSFEEKVQNTGKNIKDWILGISDAEQTKMLKDHEERLEEQAFNDAFLAAAIATEHTRSVKEDERINDRLDQQAINDIVLSTAILAESTRSISADTYLYNQNKEQDKRLDQQAINDKILATGLIVESLRSISADTYLYNQNKEQDKRLDQQAINDKILATGLIVEHLRSVATDMALGNAIYNETQRATKAEKDIITGETAFSELNINGTKVSSIDTGDETAVKNTEDNKTTLATVATVLKSAQNAEYTTTNKPTNIQTEQQVVNTEENSEKYIYATTISKAITDLDSSIGDRNIETENTEIKEALQTNVSSAIATVGNIIGDMKFEGTHYVSSSESLTHAVKALDNQVARIDNDVRNLDHRVDYVESHLRGGIAATAALTALVPNARDCGNTQISIGSGNYADKVGFAVGAFHYFSDRVLVNAGGSFATSNDWAFRAGITFGI